LEPLSYEDFRHNVPLSDLLAQITAYRQYLEMVEEFAQMQLKKYEVELYEVHARRRQLERRFNAGRPF
jgi:hypothetical protein